MLRVALCDSVCFSILSQAGLQSINDKEDVKDMNDVSV